MHILYLDHSGNPDDVRQRHVVLAGVSVFERQTHWLSQQVDEIAARFNPSDPSSVEIHASRMRGGSGFWRTFPVTSRLEALYDCCGVIANSVHSLAVFGAAIEKSPSAVADPISTAFEQVCRRFDAQLKRFHKQGNTQRGIIVFDKASYENSIQNLATDFKNISRSWGVTHNLSEVPLFLDSRASRLLQLADLVAFAIFRHFEHQDSQFYHRISTRFDRQGSTVFGLYHQPAIPEPFRLEP
jgi:hypothetical protein